MNRKVLYVHYGIKESSGWGRSFRIATSLSKIGEDVTFITLQSNTFRFPYKEEIIDNVKVVSFPEIVPIKARGMGFASISIFLKKIYLKNKRYDIIITDAIHRPSSYQVTNYIRKKHNTTIITEWWDYFGVGGQYEAKNKWFKLFFGKKELTGELEHRKNADGVVCLSEFLKTRAVLSGINKDKLSVVNGGCDIESIVFYESSMTFRDKFNIPKSKIAFGFVGITESEISDIEPFLRALAVSDKREQIILVTTGKYLSSSIKDKFKLHDILIELGWVNWNQFSEALSCVDIFLFLQKENLINMAKWPNKLGDYMASGRMILTNPISEITTFVNKYPDSFICVDWETKSLLDIIDRIVANIDLYRNRGVENRRIAENFESWQQKSTIIKNFYERIIKNKKS